MRTIATLLAGLLLTLSIGCQPAHHDLRAAALQQHVNVLAAEEMRGRDFASPEELRAANYIVAALSRAGVAPPPGWDTPVQTFSHKRGQVARNVVFGIPGGTPDLAGEWILLGAHFDHLGVRDGQVYPGADDNASGVSALIEIGKLLQANRDELGRSVMLCFFTGEERKFLGSRHFARYMPVPRERIVAMLNADMLSRGPREIHVVGQDTAGVFRDALARASTAVGLPVLFDHPEWISQSDHYVFHRMRIPILYFGVEDHEDYHQPTDTADRIDAGLLEAVTRVIYLTTMDLSQGPPIHWSGRDPG